MKVHEKIRALRREKNWTQEKMAEKLGMSLLGYAKVERGETDYQLNAENYLAKLAKIADVLSIDLDELITNSDKTGYLIGGIDNSSGCNPIVSPPTELVLENQKLQFQLEMKNKELAMQQLEIAYLKELLELYKNGKF